MASLQLIMYEVQKSAWVIQDYSIVQYMKYMEEVN